MRLRSLRVPVATLWLAAGLVGCDAVGGGSGPSAPTSAAADAKPVPTEAGKPTVGEKTKKGRQAPGGNAPKGTE